MPAQSVIERSFTGGEISPALYARVDQSKYTTGLRTARNQICMRHGGLTQRPGTMYSGTTLNGGAAVRLIPFIFNETGLGQSYVLEFGNQYITFYQNGQNIISSSQVITAITQANPAVVTATAHGFSNGDIIVIEGVLGMTQVDNDYFIVANVTANTFSLTDLLGNAINSTAYGAYLSGGLANKIYKISSSYLQADLATLQISQSADVITIVHHSYAPMELKRVIPTNWTLTTIAFGVPTDLTTVLSIVGTVGGLNFQYTITSVFSNGDEVASVNARDALKINLSEPSPTTPVTIQWSGPPSPNPFNFPIAISYRVYRAQIPASGSSQSLYGYVGTIPAPPGPPAAHATVTFVDSNSAPDYTQAPPQTSPFESSMGPGNYPSTVGFTQQRRGFAATDNNPLGFWYSKPGSFANFNFRLNQPDDDPIVGSVAGEEVNTIQHLLELKFALMLTSGAEIFVQGNGAGVLTPTTINAATQSQYGSSALKPLKVGNVLLFNQALGSFIRDFVFDFSIDGYRGNDITVFSAHLFEGHQIVDWAYQKIPDSIIWVVREDGVLLSCTYVREQQILAWTRHDFTNGFVENVCSIPENGAYSTYVVIRRVINGITVRYLERVSSRIWSDPITAPYMDCFESYDGRNVGADGMKVEASGGFVTDGTAYQQILIFSSSSPYFTTSMIGDQIFIYDAEWVSSQGMQGNQVRFTIQSYISSTVVHVTPSGVVPVELQAVFTTLWSHAVKTVSGLGYLEGQKVSVWADRFVVGSPLNKQVLQVYTVAGGSITLDKCYSVIYVGLPMIVDFETLQIDTSFGESIQDQPKNISRVIVYLYNSRGFFGGTQNPDTDPDNLVNGVVQDPLFNLTENKAQGDRLTYDAPPGVLTDSQFVNVPCNWSKEGRIFIRNVDPIPLSILAVIPAGLTAAKIPYSQRV